MTRHGMASTMLTAEAAAQVSGQKNTGISPNRDSDSGWQQGRASESFLPYVGVLFGAGEEDGISSLFLFSLKDLALDRWH